MKTIIVKITPDILREIANQIEDLSKHYSQDSLKNPDLEIFHAFRVEEDLQVSLSWFPGQPRPE